MQASVLSLIKIYTYKYKNLINRMLSDVKGRREYIKWYTEEQKELLCGRFLTQRDQVVIRLRWRGSVLRKCWVCTLIITMPLNY